MLTWCSTISMILFGRYHDDDFKKQKTEGKGGPYVEVPETVFNTELMW